MSGPYICHRQFTTQQREDDSDHGIMQNETRFLQLNPDSTFDFKYHYYYEYENSYYAMVTNLSNDTIFKGTCQKEGNKITLTVVGGEQGAKDGVKKTTLFSTKQITGKIELIEDEPILKVVHVDLKPENMDRIKEIISVSQVFKRPQ